MVVVDVNSELKRNIRERGRRLNWLTLLPKSLSAEAKNRSWWKASAWNTGHRSYRRFFG